MTDEVTVLVEDLAGAVGGKTLQNIDVGHLATGTLKLLVCHLGSEFAATDEVTIVVKDFSVVANGVASKILGITFYKAANDPSVLG
ncbi:repeatdomain containing protein [Pyrenophora tritici-repentis]|nr:repeatdomain containing protein [Pyrenophora tritici-repentis]KAI1577873.1 repeatdomain containing protein [Pyrenophora tritici-repentis]KAI1589082.1 repeatdomain containing protein [Pyrenophora tritici-repentis]